VSFVCLLGFHTPSLVSIARRDNQLVALCDNCGAPLIQAGSGRWHPNSPLDSALPGKRAAQAPTGAIGSAGGVDTGFSERR
jgi:hypothetical protein